MLHQKLLDNFKNDKSGIQEHQTTLNEQKLHKSWMFPSVVHPFYVLMCCVYRDFKFDRKQHFGITFDFNLIYVRY